MEPEQKKEDEQLIKKTPQKIITNEQIIKKSIGVFTATAFITSVTYLFALWYTFGINVFEFVDISNIIAHSILPLLYSVCVVLGWAIFFTATKVLAIPCNERGDIEPKYLSSYKKTGAHKRYPVVFSFWIVVGFVWGFWDSRAWIGTAPVIALGVALYLVLCTNKGKQFISDPNIRLLLFGVIVLFPLEGVAFGLHKAEAIKRGDKYLYVDSCNISKEVRKWDDDKIPYIGTMGDYFFFLIPSDESVYIAAKEEIKPFILERHDRLKDKNLLNWFKKKLQRE